MLLAWYLQVTGHSVAVGEDRQTSELMARRMDILAGFESQQKSFVLVVPDVSNCMECVMEPLNFCRQMKLQFNQSMNEGMADSRKRVLSSLLDLAEVSQKFILPLGGRIIEDKEFRCLDGSLPLKLPYKFICLEWQRTRTQDTDTESSASKQIVFARERDDSIIISPVCWFDRVNAWGPLPEIYIKCNDYLGGYSGTEPLFKVHRVLKIVSHEDYQDEIGALLCFLNALSCSNVKTEPLVRKKTKKLKKPYSFDEYHILTIDCPKGLTRQGESQKSTGRHPREHLRRGHIRRLQCGKKLWVNATIVNHGVGGKITKDYGVRDPRARVIDALKR